MQPLGKHPEDVKVSPFGTLAYVQGWCPHCKEFHPEYIKAQNFMKQRAKEGARFPRSFQMESIEAFPPQSIGSGVPTLIMIFNNQLVPLGKSRFWIDGKQLSMAMYALYGPFFQRWKQNQVRRISHNPELHYDDLVTQLSHPNDQQYTDYNTFIESLPHFLESN